MSPALPHTGAAYSFARSAMGPWGGMFTGLAESIEYIITPAVIVYFIGAYLTLLFGTGEEWKPAYWVGAYAIFLALNLWGVELSFRISVFVTLGALGILAIYWISAIPHLDVGRWALNIGVGPDGAAVELPEGGGSWFPFGWKGVIATLPFAVWLFLAIEQLPLAAEESADPKKDMPRGLIAGMATLMVSAMLISFLNAGVGIATAKGHGAFALSGSDWPVLDGLRLTFGEGSVFKVLGLVATIGLIASFHTIIYAYGRQIYSLARAGYYLAVHVTDERAKGSTHGALRGHRTRTRDDAHTLVHHRRQTRRSHWRHPSQYGRLWGDDFVRHARSLIHRIAPADAKYRPPLSQPTRQSWSARDHRYCARNAVRPIAGSQVPEGRVCGRNLLCARYRVLRALRPE
jgi:L-asparagine transporter-like permease